MTTEGVDFAREQEERPEVKGEYYFHETNINAWMKCYNDDYPTCGFYRIWDYEPRNLTDKMVQEVVDIAEAVSERL